MQSTGNEKDIIWWLLGIIGALVGLAYKNLLAEMKAIRTLAERSSARMKRLTDGVFLLEAKLHPEDAEEIIEVMNRVIEGDDHNRRT